MSVALNPPLKHRIGRYRRRLRRALVVILQALVCLSLIASSAVPPHSSFASSNPITTADSHPSSVQKLQERRAPARTREKSPLAVDEPGSRV